ncbi:probable terpene synthase 9 [Impatiens glandulifera]|uniref:probable terpene synthase 9 n=1 Tax=Impatiens glandulifera TaxID=253017 RepID=UPI001FB16EB4|nr:probable terpene synthase 9 [Impatiens glandulifera]
MMISHSLRFQLSLQPSLASKFDVKTRYKNHGIRPSASINVNQVSDHIGVDLRRSADYHPTIWDPKLIQSLTTTYTYELHGNRLDKLKEQVSMFLKSTKDVSILLKLIDSIQRSGVAYHFNEEIDYAFDLVSSFIPNGSGLSTTALWFRLLRQRGLFVSTDVFDEFKDENGNFLERLSDDLEGLLNLYESSFLGMCGEDDDIEEARDFSVKHLESFMLTRLDCDIVDMRNRVEDALSVPLHWRTPRLEARNFIDLCKVGDGINSSVILELATLDYNLVQSIHQEEVKELTKWWKNLGFREKLSFSRDRMVENYLWAMGIVWEPQYSKSRITLTKFICILTAIDDIFDIYGSLDELESFVIAVERWDLKAIDDLPQYMKICYLAMYNFGNETAYDVLRDHGTVVIESVKKEWERLCKSYLTEARWYYSGYQPSPNEYMENAWISVGGHGAIVHTCLLLGLFPINETSLDKFSGGSGPLYWACLITRLSNDIGTSQAEIARGDVPKSIHSYMIHNKVSEKEARDTASDIMNNSWKKLNETIIKGSCCSIVANLSLNMTRTALSIYQHGDGIGTSNGSTKDRLTLLIVEPISLY